MVTVTGADAVRLEVEKLMVTPAGAPAAERVTEEPKPLISVRFTDVVPELPWLTDTLEGLTASEKLALAFCQWLTRGSHRRSRDRCCSHTRPGEGYTLLVVDETDSLLSADIERITRGLRRRLCQNG
jgi:hypothetical protein